MPLAAAGLIFIVPGVHCLRFAEPETMRRTIAYVMLAITLLMILYPRTYFSASRWHSIIAGAIAGLIMGATSMGGPPIVLYFSGQDAETSQLKANIVVAVGILELGALLALTALRGLDLTVVLRFSVLLPIVRSQLIPHDEQYVLHTSHRVTYLEYRGNDASNDE
jgi:uncharacterized membrane protein YfcA